VVLALAGATSVVAADAPPIDASTVGRLGSEARAELAMPEGSGPFPAIVVLHGCDGVGRHYRDWVRDLVTWGYAAILVDSFRPRGFQTVCNHGMEVSPETQAEDAFAAAAYLRTLPQISGDRIGVIGFSHGGWAVLHAVLAEMTENGRQQPFAAAIAFYPGCERPGSPLVTDTLILIGDADEWTPLKHCIAWRDAAQTAGHALAMKVYHGATHGFDAPLKPHWFAGHWVGRDPEAAEDSRIETRSFLAARLTK
jgi:dienelactone hydrolase